MPFHSQSPFRFAAILALAVISGGTLTQAEVFDYSILRDGSKIGAYRFVVETNGAQRKVSVDMHVAVKLLFVTVYRASHQRRDVWFDGVLQSSEATSTYNGKHYRVGYQREEDHGVVRVNAEEQQLGGTVITLVPWRPTVANQAVMLNEKGRPDEVALTFEKKETVQLGGRAVAAEKYRLSGRKPRDVWYGADGTLILVRYENRGEMMEVVLELPAPSS